MAEMHEEKWPMGVMASIAIFFVVILMLATVAANKPVDTVMLIERKSGIELLGDSDMQKVLEKSNRYYSALVIDSRAKMIVSDMLMPRGGSVDAFDKNVDWWIRYLESRGEAVQEIIYQMVYRIVLTLNWLPLLVAVLVPANYAGWMRWYAKRHGFHYSSPFLNNIAAIVLSWGRMLIVLSVSMPLPLPPVVISTFIVIMLPVVLCVLISYLPKRN
ncbi:DUF4400 domain-containing protein [Pseudomonas aeruginosa]|uniref:DUF4400 domain-containing protein n=1 Tax=Pseudomonas aeruginosa TaxID=287 RepID=UPI001E40FD55|nr:DUF4400 domain-containing protein [Pseudomonas aeruginosa]MCC9289604.1 DUF4400 domain-containing protein [Pseudomonas aeruginosa]UVN18852.1 Hypothetical protein [Pseudomonas aeruginosa]